MVGSARKGESEEGEEGVGGENVIIQLQKLGQIIVRCIYLPDWLMADND